MALARAFQIRTSTESAPSNTIENSSERMLLEVADSETMRYEAHSIIRRAFATALANGHQQYRGNNTTASTVCLVRLFSHGPATDRHHSIHTANVGDGFWIVLRRQSEHWRCIAHSEPTYHDYQRGTLVPLQLAYDSRGNLITSNDLKRSHCSKVPVQHDDLVLALSDGAVDNLPAYRRPGQSPHRSLAEWIVLCMNRDATVAWTPALVVSHMRQLVRVSMRGPGAKYDDFTVVAARVSIGLPRSAATPPAGGSLYPIHSQT